MLGLQSAHEGNKMDVIGSFDHSFIIELRRERLHAMLQLFEQTIRANATDLQELALNLIPMENEIQVFLEKLEDRARPRGCSPAPCVLSFKNNTWILKLGGSFDNTLCTNPKENNTK